MAKYGKSVRQERAQPPLGCSSDLERHRLPDVGYYPGGVLRRRSPSGERQY